MIKMRLRIISLRIKFTISMVSNMCYHYYMIQLKAPISREHRKKICYDFLLIEVSISGANFRLLCKEMTNGQPFSMII